MRDFGAKGQHVLTQSANKSLRRSGWGVRRLSHVTIFMRGKVLLVYRRLFWLRGGDELQDQID